MIDKLVGPYALWTGHLAGHCLTFPQKGHLRCQYGCLDKVMRLLMSIRLN